MLPSTLPPSLHPPSLPPSVLNQQTNRETNRPASKPWGKVRASPERKERRREGRRSSSSSRRPPPCTRQTWRKVCRDRGKEGWKEGGREEDVRKLALCIVPSMPFPHPLPSLPPSPPPLPLLPFQKMTSGTTRHSLLREQLQQPCRCQRSLPRRRGKR